MSSDRYTRYPRAILWLVREGEVTIGGDAADARPVFRASVASFYLSKSPITNLQFEAFDPDHRRSDVSAGDDDPAVGVDWHAALAYCSWYARVSRKPIRLPTEIEWEYACRAGSDERHFFGEDASLAEPFVWDADNSGGRMRPLGEKKPSPFGLLGMLGGVWEWTSSLHLPYPPIDGDGREDLAAAGPRVVRGGSFREPRRNLGSGIRRAAPPDLRGDDIGFRIARSFG